MDETACPGGMGMGGDFRLMDYYSSRSVLRLERTLFRNKDRSSAHVQHSLYQKANGLSSPGCQKKTRYTPTDAECRSVETTDDCLVSITW